MGEIIQIRDYIKSLTPTSSNKRRLCRVVAVIDADHFEVQVYQKKPEYMKSIGMPTVVVDPNDLIVSVSPEAKGLGIKRLEKGAQAKKRCPSLFVITKKQRFLIKPDTQLLAKYSYALRESVKTFFKKYEEKGLLLEKDIQIQRTGNDELLLDLTKVVTKIIREGVSAADFDFVKNLDFEKKEMFLENRVTYKNEDIFQRILNLQKSKGGKQKTEFRLGIGGFIIMQLCDQVENETGIVCSGGVGTNKIFSKLPCKYRKPKSVAVMTREGFNRISQDMPFREITGFGGHLGDKLARCFKIGKDTSIAHLQKKIQTPRGIFLLKTVFKMEAETICRLAFARRIENVEHKLMNANVTCGKKNLRITNKSQFKTTLTLLAQNMTERLEEEVAYNKRVPTKITLEYNVKSGGKRTFDVTPSEIPQEKAVDFKDLLDESVETVIRNNQDLESDTLGIDFIKFCASGFKECTEILCVNMCMLITPAY